MVESFKAKRVFIVTVKSGFNQFQWCLPQSVYKSIRITHCKMLLLNVFSRLLFFCTHYLAFSSVSVTFADIFLFLSLSQSHDISCFFSPYIDFSHISKKQHQRRQQRPHQQRKRTRTEKKLFMNTFIALQIVK